MKKKEEEYTALEKELILHDDPFPPQPELVDSLSAFNCSACGVRLTVNEWQEYEDTCEECMHEQTSGLIDDEGEELDFEE